MVKPIGQSDGVSIQSLRLKSRRQVNRLGAHPLKGNLSLSSLRATAGPPAGVRSRSSGVTQVDGGRRSTSLFDLPRSGQGFLSRLTAQVRPPNPLIAGLSRLNRPASSSLSVLSTRDRNPTLGRSIASASSLISQQRVKSLFLDGHSRFLLAQSNANRTNRGFGVNLNFPTFSILG